MTPADLPPSEFVLAHYDDIHSSPGCLATQAAGVARLIPRQDVPNAYWP